MDGHAQPTRTQQDAQRERSAGAAAAPSASAPLDAASRCSSAPVRTRLSHEFVIRTVGLARVLLVECCSPAASRSWGRCADCLNARLPVAVCVLPESARAVCVLVALA